MLASDLESGLICGFAASPDGGLRTVAWHEMSETLATADTTVWLHFNAADRRSHHFIMECATIPETARNFLLDRDNRARLEPIEGGIAAALHDLRIEGDDDPSETGMLRFWCTHRILVTTRTIPLATLDALRRSIREPQAERGALDFLLSLFRLFEVTFARLTGELDAQFTRLEDAILAERFLEQGGELGRLRRRMVHLRRLVNPQQHAVHTLAARPPAWVDRSTHEILQDLADRLAAHALDLDHMQEGARLLQEEQASRLAEITNRNLYFLAILTAIFLPMTLVTGIFGMNVAGMPGLMGDGSFWWVVLGLGVTGVASLVLLRWKRLI